MAQPHSTLVALEKLDKLKKIGKKEKFMLVQAQASPSLASQTLPAPTDIGWTAREGLVQCFTATCSGTRNSAPPMKARHVIINVTVIN